MDIEKVSIITAALAAYTMLVISYFYPLKTLWKELREMKNECRAILSDLQDIATTVNELKNEL